MLRRSFRIDDAEVTYAYTDEHGEVLYKIARFVPQTFRPFVPSPDGKWWVMGLPKKTRRVLYQLPEVLRVREAGGTIYLVEGEKDADTVNRVPVAEDANAIATTRAGGVLGWKDYEAGYLDTLRGAAMVVIVRDRDGEDPDNPKNSYTGQRLASHLDGVLKPIVADVHVAEAVKGTDRNAK